MADTVSSSDLLRAYALHPAVTAAARCCAHGGNVHLRGALGSSLGLALSALSHKVGGTMLVVMDDEDEAAYLYHDMETALGRDRVMFFPSSYRREVRYGQRDEANEILRNAALSALSAGQPLALVTYPSAMSELVTHKDRMDSGTITVHSGDTMPIGQLEEKLTALGFRLVDYVYEPGQFAVRGSLIDVFGYSAENPVRIDFFDNEIDSVRFFNVQTQLTIEQVQTVAIVPRLDAAADTGAESLLQFIPANTLMAIKNRELLCQSVDAIYQGGFSEQVALTGKTLDRDRLLVSGDTFARQVVKFRTIAIGNRPINDTDTAVDMHVTLQPPLNKNFDLLGQMLADYSARGYNICVLSDSAKQNERLTDILAERCPGVAVRTIGTALHEGFADDTLRLCLFTDHQIFGRYHKYTLRSEQARVGKVSLTLRDIRQIERGDYVVHVDHGIGQFAGLVTIPEMGVMKEKVKIIYQGGEVYVSIHALHKISKYKGKDGEPPRINRLGSGAWENLKERTKKKIKDIARELVALYSRRQSEKGFQFSPDSYMQQELEASFPYQDTDDQHQATEAVKADMESDRPMDRLLCGDVGFGKTEVAMRAAFKACSDGKQVAVLVPTTVLAYQHYRTFSRRLRDFPVTVDYLSRARGAKATTELLANLKEGRVDIIVGTHKLLGRGVEFKDLGLLIIDEEQKFGVSTKEKLRQMRTNVDTLTLTATPIPRTLQFSLLGARDMSIMRTPPSGRQPIHTQVQTFSAAAVAEAVGFELSRGGQVFVVTPRISELGNLEQVISEHVPDARMATGHGRMAAAELEKVITDFQNHDIDVLLSTSIIENGIDIPLAGTIIINNAHHFGLSDLHQMRGRVGRSPRKAFCYLMAPPLATLTGEARRRLEALENFSALGSGLHIAMQDLDLRGAGNLLGAEQSGFIADLGYETYQKILSEAMGELRRDEFPDTMQVADAQPDQLPDCTVETDIPMAFPDSYVPGSAERMLLYRELDSLVTEKEIDAFRHRMIDRFGPLPAQAEDLIRIVPLRQLGRTLGVDRLVLHDGHMSLSFPQNATDAFFQGEAFGQIVAYAMRHGENCRLQEKKGRKSVLISPVPGVREAIDTLQAVRRM